MRANAQTWRNVAAEHQRIADAYGRGTVDDIPDWSGQAASAYSGHAQRSMEMLFALSKIGECMSVIVEASSALVEAVRTIVRDLIGECVATLLARLPIWTAEEVFTLGLATPVVTAQVSTVVARWAAKIAEHAWERSIPGVDDAALAEYLEDVMRASPGHRVRDTPNGTPRYVWWDAQTGTIIIREGDRGTFMQPDNGYA